MEAASVPGDPAVADAAPQTPAQPAPEATPQPAAPATFPPQPTPAPENDIHAQLAAMEQRINELQGQPEQPADLLEALSQAPGDLGFTPEELAALEAQQQEPGQVDPAQETDQVAEFDNYVRDLINQGIEAARRPEEVRAWQAQHPDVVPGTPLFDEFVATMENLAGRYGDAAQFDSSLMDLAYTHIKAKMADAGAVPAEQAANHGASIETQAGQPQTGEPSVAEQYVNAMLNTGGGDVFTRGG